MAVHGKGTAHFRFYFPDELSHFGRGGIPHGIGNVYAVCAVFAGNGNRLYQKIDGRSRGVLYGVSEVRQFAFGILCVIGNSLQNFVFRHFEFIFEMNGACCYKHMKHGIFCKIKRRGGSIYVVDGGSGQCGNGAVFDCGGYLLHG